MTATHCRRVRYRRRARGQSTIIAGPEQVTGTVDLLDLGLTQNARSTGRRYDRHLQLESLAPVEYERCHPEDSFEALKRRACFSKEDKGLLRDWLAVAERRDHVLHARHANRSAE